MKYALVTGASKGIGKALAAELAAKGFNLLLVSRSIDSLTKAAEEIKRRHNVKIEVLAADLSDENAPTSIKVWCIQNQFDVSVLVNNAGYGLWGYFENLPLIEQTNMMTLNMQSVVKLTHEILPLLKKSNPAYILNVSSTAAYQAVPTLSIYSATKAFVLIFSRGLRYELRKSNISVTCLSPGATRTEFMDRAGMETLKASAQKFEMSAEAVAKIGIRGMFRKKAEVITGFTNYLSAKLASLVPKSLTEKIAAGIYNA